MEHLLPKILEKERDDLYKYMCDMLESTTEQDFNKAHQRLQMKYANNVSVFQYIQKGWVGWKQMW